MKKEEDRTLLLPAELYEKIEQRAKATGFGSAHEYVVFILEEVLKEGVEEEALTEEQEEEVKKRLRALGYLE